MPDFNSAEYQQALIKQFSESLQATAALTQSVQDLHEEVRAHSDLLATLKVEIVSLKNQLAGLAKLVQGDGFTTSLTSAVVELQTKIQTMDDWKKDFTANQRGKKNNSLMVSVGIISVLATLVAAAVTVIIPLIFKG